MGDLDRDRVAQLLGIAGSSDHAGERDNAIRFIDRLLRDAGMRWPDLIAPQQQLETAVEAARILLCENEALRVEIAQLRAETERGTAVALWQEVGAKTADSHSAARWALDLHGHGRCWLSPFETHFLGTITRWHGPLTAKQRPIFRRILDRVVEHTGLSPPA